MTAIEEYKGKTAMLLGESDAWSDNRSLNARARETIEANEILLARMRDERIKRQVLRLKRYQPDLTVEEFEDLTKT
jgi:hypothetical protein